ncbi:hypothetical protein [Brassicibacter mesophilus]|uniref:hypothetical protein n=1 Tax=Brassicibacter mesophilus TaxID=745119 RepID=UPI003D1E7303
MIPKSYYNKAKDYLPLNRSTYTKHYQTLKKEVLAQKRTAFEFCIWYDFQLVDVANLNTGILSCILELIEKKHISTEKHIKNFRLACMLFHKFMQSDKKVNDGKCEEYIADHPAIAARLSTVNIEVDFISYLNYDRTSANKQMFPFFRAKEIDTNLIAELISRELLAFDCKFHNLIFINKADTGILGVEKLGIGIKHLQRLEGIRPICWSYWVERKNHINFKTDIQRVIFFDTTIRLLQYLKENYPQDNTLYCSLHTDNYLIETYTNTLELFNTDVEIQFNFENQEKIQRFNNIKKENDILEPEMEKQIPAEYILTPIVGEEIRDISKMVWIDKRQVYYDETDDTYWNIDGTEAPPF